MGRDEFYLWWLGISLGIVILSTLLYWIVEDLDNEKETNDNLYNFVEKHFGKVFLRIFKIFI